MTNPVDVSRRIAALPDKHAMATLALVLRRRGAALDPFSQQEQQARLREALGQPEITNGIQAAADATDGDLARTALTHLTDSDDTTTELVNQAIGIAQRDSDVERDPLLLFGVGALVLWVFRADIDLAHETGKGWKFRFKTQRPVRLHDRKTARTARRCLSQAVAAAWLVTVWYWDRCGAPGETRTPNLLIRSRKQRPFRTC